MEFHYLISHYGYIGLFFLLMLGIFGVPFPDETLLTFSGYLASKGDLHILLTIFVAFMGSIAGMTVNYVVGGTLGFMVIRKHGHYVHLTPGKMDQVRNWFDRFGKWTLLIGYFFPGIRHLTAFVAGTSKLRLPVFALFAYSGGFLWTLTFTLMGYLGGKTLVKGTGQVHANFLILAGIIILFLALYLFIQQKMDQRK
jgi:membrane protein DedA with SNARE-associated domain